jgi:hypothetical protein
MGWEKPKREQERSDKKVGSKQEAVGRMKYELTINAR